MTKTRTLTNLGAKAHVLRGNVADVFAGVCAAGTASAIAGAQHSEGQGATSELAIVPARKEAAAG